MNNLFLGLLIVFISLCFSAFFSLVETAVTSISSLKARHMIKERKGRGTDVLNLWLIHPHRLLASLLIANNLAVIFASIYADEIIRTNFGKSSVLLVTAVMTMIIVLFAEVIPKTFAKSYAYHIVIPALKFYKIFYLALLPFASFMTFLSQLVHKFFLRKGHLKDPQITEEELEFLISVGEQEGVIAEQKHDMLSGIFELGDTVVREIMVPRTDIIALPQNTKIIDAIDKSRESGLSRIPIYEDRIDNITGSIHVKDALYFMKKHHSEKEFTTQTVLEIKREVMFVPETKPIDHLFQEMRRQKQHMAIVLDEYGGTSGIVTMEDIFEEIVGEVRDEFDIEEEAIRPTQLENQFIVDCRIHIDDFCDFFDISLEDLTKDMADHEFDTMAGLVLHFFGHVPKTGDKFELANLTVEVVEVSKRRIRRVAVKKNV